MDREKDREILRKFIEVYCAGNHGSPEGALCAECNDLFSYASDRLKRCPYDPKPKCKDCTTHCYKPEYREKIRQVMKYSGLHFVKRGRIDWLIKYFF